MLAALLAAFTALNFAAALAAEPSLNVGSKRFAESYILGMCANGIYLHCALLTRGTIDRYWLSYDLSSPQTRTHAFSTNMELRWIGAHSGSIS
jgi:hypothetical protein